MRPDDVYVETLAGFVGGSPSWIIELLEGIVWQTEAGFEDDIQKDSARLHHLQEECKKTVALINYPPIYALPHRILCLCKSVVTDMNCCASTASTLSPRLTPVM